MSRLLPALALLAALALPAAASAKEVRSATVCGASGCNTVAGPDAQALVEGGAPTGPPPAAPFYNVRVKIDAGGGHVVSFRTAWVPSRARVRGLDEVNGRYAWMTASAEQADALNAAARGLEPFPSSRLNGWARPVSAPASAPEPKRSESGFDWLAAVLIAVAAAAVASGGGLALRRHRRGA